MAPQNAKPTAAPAVKLEVDVPGVACAALASLCTEAHAIVIRDLRMRFGDTESYVAECSCGWTGKTHTGWRTAAREARHEGKMHVDDSRGSGVGVGR